jgi:hypothetical protein
VSILLVFNVLILPLFYPPLTAACLRRSAWQLLRKGVVRRHSLATRTLSHTGTIEHGSDRGLLSSRMQHFGWPAATRVVSSRLQEVLEDDR